MVTDKSLDMNVNVQILAKISHINRKYGMIGDCITLGTAWIPEELTY